MAGSQDVTSNATTHIIQHRRSDSDIEKLAIQSTPRLGVVSNVLKKTVSHRTVDDPGPPPDGGVTAWTVLLLAHLINLDTWGTFNAFGILQTYYVKELQLPPSDISWIGSIQGFLLFFVCTFSGRLSDAGYFHQTFGVGSILMMLGIFGASASTTYWQLLLSQGICLGIGGGLCYCPAISIAATYFSKKQALALGIVASGSSTGGLIFGAILQQLLPRIGYPWTIRVIGFFILATLIPANLFIKPRRLVKNQGPIVEWEAFKEPEYSYFAVGMFFIFLGSYIPIFYVGSYGRDVIGISSRDSNALILIINGVGIVGRIPPAIVSTLFTGPMNLLIPLALGSGLLIFTWTAVRDHTGLIIFDVFYGAIMAAAQGLFPPSLGSLTTDMSRMGVRNGMVFSVIGIAQLIGTPIGGALISANKGQYLYAQVFGGLSICVGVLLVAVARCYKTNMKFLVRA